MLHGIVIYSRIYELHGREEERMQFFSTFLLKGLEVHEELSTFALRLTNKRPPLEGWVSG